MTLFIFAIIFALAAIACLGVRRSAKKEIATQREAKAAATDPRFFNSDRLDTARTTSGATAIGAGVTGVLAVLLLLWSCASQVGTGKVGVVTSFGQVKSSVGSGLVFHAPWQKVTEINAQNQRIHYNGFATNDDGSLKPNNNGILAFSSETQAVYMAVTVQLRVDPNKATDLFRNTGNDYVQKLVDARVANFTKEETVKFKATDIAPDREQIRVAVKDKLQTELAPYGITVDDFLVDNISFDKDYEAAIVAKQTNTQKAQAAQAAVATAKAEADQKVATANGDAQATIVNATAQAEANAKLAASLTPELLQSQAINKLNPNVQIITLPNGGVTLFNPADLLNGTAAAAGK